MRKNFILLSLLVTCMFFSFHGTAQVTGHSVTFVEYPGGTFVQNEDGTWKELTHTNIFSLKETSRDNSSVYLFDASRNISIQLDISRKEIYKSWDKPQKTKLYDVTKILEGPVGYTWCADDNGTFTSTDIVNVAYGANGKFKYRSGVSGEIKFDSKTFGDPVPGVTKAGYYMKLSGLSSKGPGN
jgi:hypothetical protein